MLKISIHRLLLTTMLQFAALSGAYAFNDDVNGNWFIDIEHTVQSSQLVSSQYSQNQSAKLRSRSDVIQEVKRRYNAEVLKISLDNRQQMYRVRVLMPNGKVRNLQISARR